LINTDEDGLQLVNFRVPKRLLKLYDAKCVPPGKNRAEVWRELLEKEIANASGSLDSSTLMEKLKDQRIKEMKREASLKSILEGKIIGPTGKQTVFIRLIELAVQLGSDSNLEKDFDLVVDKLKTYQCKPNDQFTENDLETFVEYCEAVQKRRQYTNQIKDLRSQQSAPLT